MRQIKRISFLMYSCLLLAAGFYGHMKYVQMFYPGSLKPAEKAVYGEATEGAAQVVATGQAITFDTVLVTLCYDLESGETVQAEETMPAKYVGLDRDAFIRCMEDEASAPALAERKKGLFSIEVQSFSAQRVVVRRSYQKQDREISFYLMIEDNLVTVYEADRSTVYMRTFIDARTLPQLVRDELLLGMTLEGTEQVEEFVTQYGHLPASE